jgi:hypothetical protein
MTKINEDDTTWMNGYAQGFSEGAIAAMESLVERGHLSNEFVEEFKSNFDLHAEVVARLRDNGLQVDVPD